MSTASLSAAERRRPPVWLSIVACSVPVLVELASVGAGHPFTLALPGWSQPLPDSVTWFPLVGHPVVRRTRSVWNAGSHRRDLGHLVAALDQPTAS
ncbi:hypothetical protein [Streptomyces pseudogriseolus]|uniref:hypothetical protein n=1 Tax=Streptomyces pseudogriseolus TaxID=36817 RepID=UPI003FA25BBE